MTQDELIRSVLGFPWGKLSPKVTEEGCEPQ